MKVKSLAIGVSPLSLTAFMSPSPVPSTVAVYVVLIVSGSVGFSTAVLVCRCNAPWQGCWSQ
jgi:hypothetical protein